MTATLDALAALAPLGLLSETEAEELRRLVDAGGAEAVDLVRGYGEAVVQIADSLDPVTPPADVRQRVLQSFAPQRRIVRSDEGKWLDLAPGVRVKKLSSDRSRNTVTVLLEMAPGSVLPPHDHRHPEDTFIVSGSARIGNLVAFAGDFHRAEAGSHHDPIVSDDGCTALIMMDAEDYLAA